MGIIALQGGMGVFVYQSAACILHGV